MRGSCAVCTRLSNDRVTTEGAFQGGREAPRAQRGLPQAPFGVRQQCVNPLRRTNQHHRARLIHCRARADCERRPGDHRLRQAVALSAESVAQTRWRKSAAPHWPRYRTDAPEVLEAHLRAQHLVLDAARTSQNAYGVVYEIEGPIATPSGHTVRFCSIWQIDTGSEMPRFITMYPR
jgi:hypothetical protein